MESVLTDLRWAIRSLLKHPGFTGIVVFTLALGIGASSTIFSIVNAVLLRPLPFASADRLVMLWGNFSKLNIDHLPAKAAEYDDYLQETKSFASVAAFDGEDFSLTGGEQAERIHAARVTSNLFSLLGAQAATGRTFGAEENQAGHDNVVILSYGLWQKRFGGDANVLNRALMLDDRSYRVIGVMPANFQFPPANFPTPPAEVWVPLVYTTQQVTQRQGPYYLNVIAGLKPDVNIEQARAEMTAIARRFELEQPGYRGPHGEDGGWSITVSSLQDEIVGNSRNALLLLFGAVTFVLLIACANTGNLLLVRADQRRHEIAIRKALGASRGRIMRQFLVETLLLTSAGGTVGLLLAHWALAFLKLVNPANLPRVHEIRINTRVVIFAFAISIVSGFFFGLLPAISLDRIGLQSALKDAPRGRRRRFGSRLLVISEIALSLVLLVGAGLLMNSLHRLLQVTPAIAIDQLTTAKISLSPTRYREARQVSDFYEQLSERFKAMPGVQAVSFSTLQPLSGAARNDPFAIEGRALDPANLTTAGWQVVGANYLHTLGIPLVKGRDIQTSDLAAEAPAVAVINERMASRYWPNEDPIDRRISLGRPSPTNPWVTIVGIAMDLPHRTTASGPEPDWYLSRTVSPQRDAYLFVRTVGNSIPTAREVQHAVAAIDASAAVTNIQTMKDMVATTTAPRRFNTFILVGFAMGALILAGLGMYSVISYSVRLRRQEIGIRMALGASRGDVLMLVIRSGMALALIGTAIGLVGALALSRLLSSLLFDVSATDPSTYGVVTVGSLMVALLACFLPARTATKIDPQTALRRE